MHIYFVFQWAGSSVYYLLNLWSRSVTSVRYLKSDKPNLLDEYAKKLRHRKANNDRRMGREMGSYKDVLLRIHEQSFRIQVEMALTDGADHNCGGCMDEVEKVM